MWQAFWAWYDRHYVLNVSVAFGLFLLQIVHLGWLGGDVIAARLLGAPLFEFPTLWQFLIILVDYTEIPAIFSISLVYIDAIRRGQRATPFLMLFLLHTQWLHIFWITDEFVVNALVDARAHSTVLPAFLAWVAILIDYLELPVITDTALRLSKAIKERRGLMGVKKVLEEDEV